MEVFVIPVSDAVDFLSQAAPRPWVTRMLHAMLLNDELQAWFVSGKTRSEIMVAAILDRIEDMGLEPPSDERDARVRSELGDEIADLIAGKNWQERVVEYEMTIEPDEMMSGLVYADLGFIHYGEIDWESGDLICNFIPEKAERPDHLWMGSEDYIGSDYEMNEATAEFRGLHLAKEKIELLLPSHHLNAGKGTLRASPSQSRRVGRPPKWNWEGALTFVVTRAQTPDGLPTGPGAQSEIETMIADWFEGQTGNSPSISQIRERASRIMKMVENS